MERPMNPTRMAFLTVDARLVSHETGKGAQFIRKILTLARSPNVFSAAAADFE